jgi:hypothetical protein
MMMMMMVMMMMMMMVRMMITMMMMILNPRGVSTFPLTMRTVVGGTPEVLLQELWDLVGWGPVATLT